MHCVCASGRAYSLPPHTPVRHVYRHGKQFNTIQNLKDATKDEWDAITEVELKTLVASMPNRVIEVIQKNGGETNYL
uniref:Uncharacterized protein n=1 Tax=Caenorhabditis japonica TaxID=281687 RepID=A0A8R1E5N6_CAEJA